MKTRMKATSSSAVAVAAVAALATGILFPGSAALAAGQSPSAEQLLQLTQTQQRQIDQLKAMLDKTKGTAEQAASNAAAAKAAAKAPSMLDSVKIGGVMEVEATDSKTFAGVDSSDITLAKVEVYLDAQPHEYLATHVQLLYEDDGNENIVLDEAFATLGNTEKYPLYVQAGKWAQSFGGGYDTAMSTDPLTKSLGETKEAVIAAGLVFGGATLEAYVYNGDTQQTGDNDEVDQFGLSASYAGEVNGVGFEGGVGYLYNMADSDGLTTALGNNATSMTNHIAGVEAHGAVNFGALTLRAGYMTALDSFQSGEVAFNGQGAKPKAWTTEASYVTSLMGKETTLALTVQGTDEALALSLPETRIGGAVTVGIFDKVSVTGEYLHDEDYGTGEGGTGTDGHTATVKLAAEF